MSTNEEESFVINEMKDKYREGLEEMFANPGIVGYRYSFMCEYPQGFTAILVDDEIYKQIHETEFEKVAGVTPVIIPIGVVFPDMKDKSLYGAIEMLFQAASTMEDNYQLFLDGGITWQEVGQVNYETLLNEGKDRLLEIEQLLKEGKEVDPIDVIDLFAPLTNLIVNSPIAELSMTDMGVYCDVWPWEEDELNQVQPRVLH
jgi:hypothetical protein